MKTLVLGFIAMGVVSLLSGCAASAAAEEGVADNKNHAEAYKPSPTNNGSFMAIKLTDPAAAVNDYQPIKVAPLPVPRYRTSW
jgi:hypothetical protein